MIVDFHFRSSSFHPAVTHIFEQYGHRIRLTERVLAPQIFSSKPHFYLQKRITGFYKETLSSGRMLAFSQLVHTHSHTANGMQHGLGRTSDLIQTALGLLPLRSYAVLLLKAELRHLNGPQPVHYRLSHLEPQVLLEASKTQC